MFVKELRLRVEHYFKIVVRTLRVIIYLIQEIIPKNVGNFLVRESQESLQYSLYNELLKNEEIINALSEPLEITQQRETAQKTLDVLNKAKRIIRRQISAEEQKEELEKSKIRG